MSFKELREKYDTFVYDSYDIEDKHDNLVITYNFDIPKLMSFHPQLIIPKKFITNEKIDYKFRDNLIFQIGLVEMISYYKCCCSPKLVVRAGYLDYEQIEFFRKLFYYGLGEFFYVNGISIELDDLFMMECLGERLPNKDLDFVGKGILVPVGGGKDSCVSLEILKNYDSYPVIQNPKDVEINCVKAASIDLEKLIVFERTIEKEKFKLLEEEGFLNGHTPFSALLAFQLYLVAYLSGKKYIALSNENSANEGTVIGTKTNHQYSKTFEFERDFNNYVNSYLQVDVHYFSFLRALSEYQIGMLFSHYEKYHSVFKSCNVGSKNKEWNWCGSCPKCLFVFIILSPYLYKDKLVNIFKKDLFRDQELLPILKELLGETGVKPFECVGEVEEVKYALALCLRKYGRDNLPCLLEYFRENYLDKLDSYLDYDLEHRFNTYNLIPKKFQEILQKELDKYV